MRTFQEASRDLELPASIELAKADAEGRHNGWPYRINFQDKTHLIEMETEFAEWLANNRLIHFDAIEGVDFSTAEEPCDIERFLVYLVDARTSGQYALTYLPEEGDDFTFYFMVEGPDREFSMPY